MNISEKFSFKIRIQTVLLAFFSSFFSSNFASYILKTFFGYNVTISNLKAKFHNSNFTRICSDFTGLVFQKKIRLIRSRLRRRKKDNKRKKEKEKEWEKRKKGKKGKLRKKQKETKRKERKRKDKKRKEKERKKYLKSD